MRTIINNTTDVDRRMINSTEPRTDRDFGTWNSINPTEPRTDRVFETWNSINSTETRTDRVFGTWNSINSTETRGTDRVFGTWNSINSTETRTDRVFGTWNSTPGGVAATAGAAACLGATEQTAAADVDDSEVVIAVLKAIVVLSIIGSAVFGNLLVIVSVFRFEKLRLISNSFIVSLAFADLLVACLVMPFNASQEVVGRWVFGETVCDIFNANDVLFSTASLLHLCCISVDRYIAITDPFHYEKKMTVRRVAVMLCCIWSASIVLSHLPIHLQWHTTTPYDQYSSPGDDDGDTCSVAEQCFFQVNKPYGIISSTISFWTPTIVMVFTYVKIYRAARRQERHIRMTTSISTVTTSSVASSSSHHNRAAPGGITIGNGGGGSRPMQVDTSAAGAVSPSTDFDPERSRQHRRQQMKREHKAAKTLGVIMGAFLCCWLPFFTWYLTVTMCGRHCPPSPPIVIATLFWIGYVNSALNPVIYALFNRDFRNAFRRLLGCRRPRRKWPSVDDLQGAVVRRYVHRPCSGTGRTTEETTLRG